MIRAIASTLILSGAGIAAMAGTLAATQVTAPEVYALSEGGRSYMGVDIQDVTSDRVGPLKLKEERGVEVTMVDQDAPAGKAGIKEHDVILQFNGTAVESEEQLRRLLREIPPGRNVTLGISRDGNPLTINMQLADRGKIATTVKPKMIIPRTRGPEMEVPGFAIQVQSYSAVLGVQTENLTRQLGEYFGVKNGEGVLVRSVEKGSVAEKAGLKAGDVLIRADNEKLSDRADLSQILRHHRGGGKINLGIMRDKHEQTIVVDVPKRGSDDSFLWRFPEDFEANWRDLEDRFEDLDLRITPSMNRAMATLKQARELRPDVKEAVRQAQENLRRAQKALERSQREMEKSLRNLI